MRRLCVCAAVLAVLPLSWAGGDVGRLPMRSAKGRPPAKADLVPEFERLGLTPRNQEERGLCSLFAVLTVAEFELARGGAGPARRLSPEFLTWASNEASGLKQDGFMFYQAAHGLNALGSCTEELMPYQGRPGRARRPSARALANARTAAGRWRPEWIKRWDVKAPLTDAQLTAIKRAIANGHPVACGLRWPKALPGSTISRFTDIKRVPAPSEVFDGHSVVFVAYQDGPRGEGTFTFRNSWGPAWGKGGHGTMSYAYVRAYANDAFWLRLGPPGSEVPTVRYEAESCPVVARTRCGTVPQKMAGWGAGMWSGGAQLFFGAELGGGATLAFDVAKTGRYRVRVLATAAPDFGVVRVSLDGKPGKAVDLYSGRVSPWGPLELGTFALRAGQHRMAFAVTGKHPASTGYKLGVDAIDLFAED